MGRTWQAESESHNALFIVGRLLGHLCLLGNSVIIGRGGHRAGEFLFEPIVFALPLLGAGLLLLGLTLLGLFDLIHQQALVVLAILLGAVWR